MKIHLPLVLACLGAGSTAQAVVLVNVTDNGGTWTYEYTVANPPGSFDIWAWSLDLAVVPDWNQDDTGAGGDVTVPTDWIAMAGTLVLGVAAQDFSSQDPSADVVAGSVLPGFSFTSAFPPGPVTYYEFDALGADSNSGITQGPIPEPASVAVVAGLGLVLWAVSRRRRAS